MKVQVTVLTPDRPILEAGAQEREILKELRRAAGYARGLFNRTTTTWDERPEFTIDGPRTGAGLAKVAVSTDSETYALVDKGAKPHVIRPKYATRLRYRSGYRPKTKPGVFRSYRGGKFGPFITRLRVFHPGFEGRGFVDAAGERMRVKTEDLLWELVKRAAKRGNSTPTRRQRV